MSSVRMMPDYFRCKPLVEIDVDHEYDILAHRVAKTSNMCKALYHENTHIS